MQVARGASFATGSDFATLLYRGVEGASSCLVVDVLDACLSGTHIPALATQLAHASQSQLTEVALLYPASYQGHGNVPLDAVYAHLHSARDCFRICLQTIQPGLLSCCPRAGCTGAPRALFKAALLDSSSVLHS